MTHHTDRDNRSRGEKPQMLMPCELMLFTNYFTQSGRRDWSRLVFDFKLHVNVLLVSMSFHPIIHFLSRAISSGLYRWQEHGAVKQSSFHLTELLSPFHPPRWTKSDHFPQPWTLLRSSLHGYPAHTHTRPTNICAPSPLIRHDVSFHLISSDPCFFLIEAAANTIMVRIIPDWCEDGLTGLRR